MYIVEVFRREVVDGFASRRLKDSGIGAKRKQNSPVLRRVPSLDIDIMCW
jgi:hypothetical protein